MTEPKRDWLLAVKGAGNKTGLYGFKHRYERERAIESMEKTGKKFDYATAKMPSRPKGGQFQPKWNITRARHK
jgi:hypothetical protein